MLEDLPYQLVSLKQFPQYQPGPETGRTFRENAVQKAEEASAATGLPAVADDSGLEVDALGGLPGIYSARYGGPELDDEGRNQLLLEHLAHVEPAQRTARYRVVLALTVPGDGGRPGETVVVEGTVEGWIGSEPRGTGGFGYDPIFYLLDEEGRMLQRSMAELTPAEKDAISHRGQALRRLRNLLQERGLPG